MLRRPLFFRSLFSREFSIIKKRPTFYLSVLGILSALSYVMMLVFHFPIFAPPFDFLKVDFADVCVAVAAVVLGPVSAVAVALIKCLLYLPIDLASVNVGVGVLSNFICAFFFGLAAAAVWHLRTLGRGGEGGRGNAKRDALFLAAALIAGVLVETAAALVSNWFVIVPLYLVVMGEFVRGLLYNSTYIFGFALPFNLIKFSIQAAVAYLLCQALVRVLPKAVKDFAPAPVPPSVPAPAPAPERIPAPTQEEQIAGLQIEKARLEVEKLERERTENTLMPCPYCGASGRKSDRKCSQCGAELP
jgi:riboflavin transporter FmnP